MVMLLVPPDDVNNNYNKYINFSVNYNLCGLPSSINGNAPVS